MSVACPSCLTETDHRTFKGNYGQDIVVDLCHSCNGIWFDDRENLALTPGSTLELFQLMHDERAQEPTRLSDTLACPRCDNRLKREMNMVRSTRYTHFRCPERHGQFITFFEFLREKNFVRKMSGDKLKELRRHVQAVNCSNCGAPIDLHRTTICQHCRSPLALLDPNSMQKMVDELQERQEKLDNPATGEALAADMMMDRLKTERVYAELDRTAGGRTRGLVDVCLDVLFSAMTLGR